MLCCPNTQIPFITNRYLGILLTVVNFNGVYSTVSNCIERFVLTYSTYLG